MAHITKNTEPKKLSFDVTAGENKGWSINVRDENYNSKTYIATTKAEKDRIIGKLSMAVSLTARID